MQNRQFCMSTLRCTFLHACTLLDIFSTIWNSTFLKIRATLWIIFYSLDYLDIFHLNYCGAGGGVRQMKKCIMIYTPWMHDYAHNIWVAYDMIPLWWDEEHSKNLHYRLIHLAYMTCEIKIFYMWQSTWCFGIFITCCVRNNIFSNEKKYRNHGSCSTLLSKQFLSPEWILSRHAKKTDKLWWFIHPFFDASESFNFLFSGIAFYKFCISTFPDFLPLVSFIHRGGFQIKIKLETFASFSFGTEKLEMAVFSRNKRILFTCTNIHAEKGNVYTGQITPCQVHACMRASKHFGETWMGESSKLIFSF